MDNIFNKNGCFYRALDDEPIFVLLARDPCFAEAVRWWVTLRQALIGSGQKPLEDHEVLADALSTATAGLVWRNDATDPAKGYDAGEHARWHVEKAPDRDLVEVVLHPNKAKGAPEGGYVLPYDDWLTVLQTAMALGNRFLLWEIDGELVFNENNNYRDPDGKPDWSGYYPIQRSLQKDMLWQALRDFKEARQHKVDTVRRLIEAPTYANILRRANELGTEGCPSELLTKYLLTFEDDVPVTFYAGDIRKALEALRRERDLAGRPKTIKYFENAEDEEGREVTPMSLNRIAEMLDYATVYGEWDENTPNGATTGLAGEPMNDYRRNAIVLYKKVLGVLPEDYVVTRPETVKQTSGAGEIDPAKEALWIDMAEECGFLSAEDAEKARAALPEGTKAAVPGKHLTFIVRDLAKKIATGLRQVTGEMAEAHKSYTEHGDDYVARHDTVEEWMDRVNGYAAELEAGEIEAARFRSNPLPLRRHWMLDETLGAPYTPSIEPQPADPYKALAASIGVTPESLLSDYRKRFPEMRWPGTTLVDDVPPGVYYGIEGSNFYDAATNAGLGNEFYAKWRSRSAEFPQKVHDEVAIPAELVAKGVVDDLVGQLGRSYEDVAADYRRAAGIMEDAPLTARINVKAESDTLDVTDTPDLPPHRFTMFTKASGWAYGRGLEINPAHIPDMLDRMEADGWHLQAVFEGTVADKVGMLFKRSFEQHADFRKPWERIGSWCGKGLWVAGGLSPHRLQQLRDRISAGERLNQDEEPCRQPPMPPSVAEMMAAPTEGIDDADTDYGADDSWMGRGQEP